MNHSPLKSGNQLIETMDLLHVVLLALWTSTVSTYRPESLDALSGRIEELAETLLQCRRLPGLTVAVVRVGGDGKKPDVLTGGFGLADVGSGRRVGPATRFCVAGVTQSFTAAVLAQLLHENQTFNLDTPISEITGAGFQLSDPLLSQLVTVRDVLSHSVGIAPYFGGFVLGYNMTRAEVIRRLRYVPTVAPFRKSFVPCPLLYVLAGQLVQALNDSTWEHVVTKRLLKPLDMTSTTFADKVPNWSADFAIPHVLKDSRHVPILSKITGNILRPVGPSGSICSTAGDMAQWMAMLLNNGSNGNQQILDNEVVDELLTPQNFHFPEIGRMVRGKLPVEASTVAYNFGWITGSYRGRRRYYQNAFSNYYGSFVTLLPEEGIGIFTAANGPSLASMDNAFRVLHYYISDLLLGEEPWIDLHSTACTFPRPWFGPSNNQTRNMVTTEYPIKKIKMTPATGDALPPYNNDTINYKDLTSNDLLKTLASTVSAMAETVWTPLLTSVADTVNVTSTAVTSEFNDTDNDVTLVQKIVSNKPARSSTVAESRISTPPTFSKSSKSTSANIDKGKRPTSTGSTVEKVETTNDEDYDVVLKTTPFEILKLESFTKMLQTAKPTASVPKTTSSHKLKYKRPTTVQSHLRSTERDAVSSFKTTVQDDFGSKSTVSDITASVMQNLLGLFSATHSSVTAARTKPQRKSTTENRSRSTPAGFRNNVRHRFRRPLINNNRTRLKYPLVRTVSTTPSTVDVVSKRILKGTTSSKFTTADDFSEIYGLRISDSPTATTLFNTILDKISSSIGSNFVTTKKSNLEGSKVKFTKKTKTTTLAVPFYHTDVVTVQNSDPTASGTMPLTEDTTTSEGEMITRLLNYSKAISDLETTYTTGDVSSVTFDESTSTSVQNGSTVNGDVLLLDGLIQDAINKMSSTESSIFVDGSKSTRTSLDSSTPSNGSLTTQLVDMIFDALTSAKTESSNEASVVEHVATEWTTAPSTKTVIATLPLFSVASTPEVAIQPLVASSSNTLPSLASPLPSLPPIINSVSRFPLSFLQFLTTPETPMNQTTESPMPVYTPSRRFPVPSRRRLSGRQRTLKVSTDDVTDVVLHLGSQVMQQNRRAKRTVNPFPKHVGMYSHQFFGNLVVSFNRTSGTLQMEYGFYGRAHLVPKDNGSTFKLRFFSAIWYASESDDTRKWPGKVFLVHFKRALPTSIPSSVVIPLFEPRIPPVFIRTENL